MPTTWAEVGDAELAIDAEALSRTMKKMRDRDIANCMKQCVLAGINDTANTPDWTTNSGTYVEIVRFPLLVPSDASSIVYPLYTDCPTSPDPGTDPDPWVEGYIRGTLGTDVGAEYEIFKDKTGSGAVVQNFSASLRGTLAWLIVEMRSELGRTVRAWYPPRERAATGYWK